MPAREAEAKRRSNQGLTAAADGQLGKMVASLALLYGLAVALAALCARFAG